MERLISDEERIRRAEDILERRKNTDLRISSSSFSTEKSSSKVRKMLVQILICLCIYCGVYYFKNSQNEGLKSITQKLNVALQNDSDFKGIYNFLCAKFKNFSVFANSINQKDEENLVNQETGSGSNLGNGEAQKNEGDLDNKEAQENGNNLDKNGVQGNEANLDNKGVQENESNLDKNKVQENENNSEVQNNNEDNFSKQENNAEGFENALSSLGIGGGFEETAQTDEKKMLEDAMYILERYNPINPLKEGVVTSKFGTRNSSSIVSGNHKGIDLGAKTGTTIISASDGKVVEASSEGDFGVHLKVQIDDTIFIYAHCSKLCVGKGDIITKGQKIAEVGSTGKATGPHLHFEIRKDNQSINPDLIMEF